MTFANQYENYVVPLLLATFNQIIGMWYITYILKVLILDDYTITRPPHGRFNQYRSKRSSLLCYWTVCSAAEI